MNERRSDFELLREFVTEGGQRAFADLVRRHLDLVFATALRKVEDAGGAEEVAQNVFAALGRKAWQFAPDDSVPAWLYKTALLESKGWLRGELRRRRREQTAAELGTTMKTTDDQAACGAWLPLLDEALLSLREKERVALLLRYYEKRPLREVGAALGVSEDTAQKRVAGALEKLAGFFQRRGYRTATLAGMAVLLETTSASTSAATAAIVAGVALKNVAAVSGPAVLLARLASLSKVQTAAICVALAVGPVGWQMHSVRRERVVARQLVSQLSSTETELSAVGAEVEDSRQAATRWEDQRSRAAEARAERVRVQESFEAWKKRLRERLLAADFQWTDDSPFVRIPKWVLPDLRVDSPLARPGIVSQEARELLGLTPEERGQLESALRKYFVRMDELMGARVYETNASRRIEVPAGALASKLLVQPALGDEAKSSSDELLTALSGTLGDERWKMVQPYLEERGIGVPALLLDLEANQKDREVAVWILEKNGKLVVQWAQALDFATSFSSYAPLDWFSLGSTNRTISVPDGKTMELSLESQLGIYDVAPPLSRRILDWVQQEAEKRLATKGNP